MRKDLEPVARAVVENRQPQIAEAFVTMASVDYDLARWREEITAWREELAAWRCELDTWRRRTVKP